MTRECVRADLLWRPRPVLLGVGFYRGQDAGKVRLRLSPRERWLTYTEISV